MPYVRLVFVTSSVMLGKALVRVKNYPAFDRINLATRPRCLYTTDDDLFISVQPSAYYA